MASIGAPVGNRSGAPVRNRQGDQKIIIDLLAKVPAAAGGQLENWGVPIDPGPDGVCAEELAAAILGFQSFWQSRGKLRVADGAIDPGGSTFRQLLAVGVSPRSTGTGVPAEGVTVTITEEPVPIDTRWRVVHPAVRNSKGVMTSSQEQGKFKAFHLKVEKPQGIFWVGAAVPDGCTDFSHAHIFHHPSANQHKNAKKLPDCPDEQYEMLGGGWRELERNYTHLVGVQHAASGIGYPLLVPLIRFSAYQKPADSNDIFASSPITTIREILLTLSKGSTNFIANSFSTSSFSNGIVLQANTISHFGGLVKYAVDYDSAHLKNPGRNITPTSNMAVFRYSGKPNPARSTREFVMPWHTWPPETTGGLKEDSVVLHHNIVMTCHFDAMKNNTVKSL
jgi:hypothetical protein